MRINFDGCVEILTTHPKKCRSTVTFFATQFGVALLEGLETRNKQAMGDPV
jgi:hypothetical protein